MGNRRMRPHGNRDGRGNGGNDRNRRDRGNGNRRGGGRGGRGPGGQGPGGQGPGGQGPGGQGRGGDRGPGPARNDPPDFWSRLLDGGGDRYGEGNDFLEKTPCPACDTLPARILGRLGPTILRKCRSCSLVYVSPRLAASVRQEMLRREPSPLSSERNLMLRHAMADRMEQMHREMPSVEGMAKRSSTLLEVGCRWGHFLQLCRPHYRSVEGLEWSKERAAFAGERFDLKVSATDIFRDPWPAGYNIIVAWEILEREPYPLELLRWMHDHLLPGGQLVLGLPNYGSLFRRLLGKRWRHFDPSRNLCYFTPATLSALLRKAGFDGIEVRTSGIPSLRDRSNRHNRVDRTLDARGQWLQSLRGRETVEASARERSVPMRRDTAFGAFRKRLLAALGSVLTAPGWGDTMRVYARKAQ